MYIKEVGCEVLVWILMVQKRDYCRTVVTVVKEVGLSKGAKITLIS